jgi:hypothetical protein
VELFSSEKRFFGVYFEPGRSHNVQHRFCGVKVFFPVAFGDDEDVIEIASCVREMSQEIIHL